MLQKVRGVRQDVADRERHWFQDELAPIMVADGQFATHSIAAEFDSRTAAIDPHLRRFIRNKIDEAATQLPVAKNPS